MGEHQHGVESKVQLQDEARSSRTIDVDFATERPVNRFYGRLRLRVSSDAIDQDRLRLDQLPFLANHNSNRPIGNVESIAIDEASGVASASVRMDDSRSAAEVLRMMENRIQSGISPGINILRMDLVDEDADEDKDRRRRNRRTNSQADTDALHTVQDDDSELLFEATRWELVEISSTPIPANPEAMVRLSDDDAEQDVVYGAVINDQMAYEAWQRRHTVHLSQQTSRTDDEMEAKLGDEQTTQTGQTMTRIAEGLEKLNGRLEAMEERLGDTPSSEATTVEPSETAAQTERARILELGIQHGQTDMAVEHKGTLDEFRDKLLTIQFQPNPVSRQPRTEGQRFDFGKLIMHLADPLNRDVQRHAAFEIEAIREHDLAAKIPSGGLTGGAIIPIEKLAVTTTVADGAIQTSVDLGRAYQWLRDQAMIGQLCTLIPGLTGNLEFPVVGGGTAAHGVTTGYNAEGTLQADSTPATFGTVNLSPKTLSARTTLTRQSVMQTGGWLDGFIREMIGLQFGEGIDAAILKGSGTNNEARGILETTGIIEETAYTDLAYDTLVGLVARVMEGKHADRGGRAFVMDTKAFATAQTISKDPGSGMFLIEPGSPMTVAQLGPGARYSIDGYRAIPTTLMPDDTFLFGEFRDVYLALWDGLILRVDDVTDATNFKISAAQFYDVGVARPSGFATVAAA